MQMLYGQQTRYFYKQTSHSTCQVGQLQVGQHHRMSGTKLFSMTAAQTIQAVRRRRRRKTKIQWMPVISSTLKTYMMMMQKLRPHNSRHQKRHLNRCPNRHPKQSGAPANDARADNIIVVPLTAEEMVILTSGDEEPAAEQEENQPPGPVEVFSIGLNEQQTPVSCKWGSFCFPLTTLLLFIYVFAKYYVSFQLLLKLWRTVHQRLGMQSSSFSTNLNLNRQQYMMLHHLQVGPLTLPQCRLHRLQVGLHKVQHQVTFFQLCCLVIGFTNSCFFPLLLFALIHF